LGPECRGFDLADYDFYLNTIASGVLPTFVSTINFERFIAKMLNLKTIKEAVLFPRATRNTSNKP
jgi:aspartyl/asparaginyl-tRNA synthetase